MYMTWRCHVGWGIGFDDVLDNEMSAERCCCPPGSGLLHSDIEGRTARYENVLVTRKRVGGETLAGDE